MAVNQLGDGSTDGVSFGGPIVGNVALSTAAGKFGFYGATPVVQRATATSHSTSNAITSSSFGAIQSAALLEIINTLVAVGLWAA